MSNSMFLKACKTEAEQARKSFEKSRDILQQASSTLVPNRPTKEVLDLIEKIRVQSEQLHSLLDVGINSNNINKIDEAARVLGRTCLNIQQFTIGIRAKNER